MNFYEFMLEKKIEFPVVSPEIKFKITYNIYK